MEFTGKTAIITGGASGMGAATARLFAKRGGIPLIVDRNEPLARAVAAEIGADEPLCGDVTDSAFCDDVVAHCKAAYDQVDYLVNAAGIIARAGGLATDDATWERVMAVNVHGTFYMCRAALREMVAQGQGAIVNFGSIWGGVGAAGVLAYCTSKGAVHNMTRALALEHAQDNIRINAVCPGEVDTPMLASARSEPVTAELMARLAATVPTGRLAHPSEIAEVVLFLLSDRASYMTGSLVNVDAAFTAR